MRICNRDELQGVIAHELGHVRNRDILLMLFAGVMAGAVVITIFERLWWARKVLA